MELKLIGQLIGISRLEDKFPVIPPLSDFYCFFNISKIPTISVDLTPKKPSPYSVVFFLSRWQKLFDWNVPKAGAISFVHLKHELSSTQFCEKVVKECQVLLLPSECYEYDGHAIDKGFRVGFARKNMSESVLQLDCFLEKNFTAFK